MRIGIIGSGSVGQVLGSAFTSLRHDVRMGSRNPRQHRIQEWVARAGPGASAGTFAEATAFGDLLVVATLWSGTEEALKLAGPENAAGKIVIDVTNPLDFSGPMPKLAVGHTDSGGEQVQRWLPNTRVVKAFNTIGNAHMFQPQFPGGPPEMFICGNDDTAKADVTNIVRDFGWSVLDLGGIEASRYLEPLAMVWILHYFRSGSGDHAFKLLRK